MYNYPIHFKTFGNGKKFVLFLHGWGGSTNSFLSVAKRLSNEYKVVILDLYGFGKTKFPKVPIDTYEYATQIYLFLKNKSIDELDIVAHSFGGRIAMVLASAFDIKINNLILVSSAGVVPKKTLSYKYRVLKYKIYKRLNKLNLISSKKLSTFGSDEYKQLDSLQKISYVKIVNQGLEYLMKDIKSKVLLVWGDQDTTTPMYMARIIKDAIPNAGLYVYANSGHFAYLENYVNFCNLLLTFLKG